MQNEIYPFKIRIADLNVLVAAQYPFAKRHCADYLSEFESPDVTVAVTDEDIDREMALADHPVSRGYAEFICIHRAIALQLPRFGGFVFHASVVECDGQAYAFSAPSGTGKSTHTALWLEAFGDRARVINGDKPILRFREGQLYAYGTPWCGKEGLSTNASAPLRAICFLTRGIENAIQSIGNDEAVKRLFAQILLPDDTGEMLMLLDLLDRMIKKTPTYLLACNTQKEAALVAYHGMNREDRV